MKPHALPSILLLPALIAVGFAACRDDGVQPTPGDPNSITIGDNFFDPNLTNVDGGTEVTWTWAGNNPHSVRFDDGFPGSEIQQRGSLTRNFEAAGTFTYFCSVHGRDVMSGTVVVKDPTLVTEALR